METLLNIGVDWIVGLQGLGDWLILPMQAFSFLGSEDFFMLVLPALYWSVDAALGLRVGVILLLSSALIVFLIRVPFTKTLLVQR